ncbi:MAG: peptidyl-prolyl cis-trans isomerase [Chromatiales bacterium]|nr:peptidyl-prolyl cis-trans isomerase [Chromatiales bacterium]
MAHRPDEGGGAAGVRRNLLREPLVHFLAAGALLFVLYAVVGEGGDAPEDSITVSAARVEALAAGFERAWARPPTRAELDELIDEYVVEEIYYREALAAGLDRDDTVIRRRLRQKMEFLADPGPADATDAELEAHLARHAERFAGPGRTDFRHVFIAADGDAAAERRAARLLAQLRSGQPVASLADPGDATLLPSAMEGATDRDIESVFGGEVQAAIAGAPLGAWQGPVRSGYGWHLLQVTARVAGTAPPLDLVRPQVLADWQEEQRRAAVAANVDQLRRRYRVTVEGAVADGAARR